MDGGAFAPFLPFLYKGNFLERSVAKQPIRSRPVSFLGISRTVSVFRPEKMPKQPMSPRTGGHTENLVTLRALLQSGPFFCCFMYFLTKEGGEGDGQRRRHFGSAGSSGTILAARGQAAPIKRRGLTHFRVNQRGVDRRGPFRFRLLKARGVICAKL